MISFTRFTCTRSSRRNIAAMAVAVVVGQLTASWLSLCGTSPDALAALALGFGLGVVLTSWLADRVSEPAVDENKKLAIAVLAGTVVAMSWCVPAALNATLLAGCDSIGSNWPFSTFLTMLFPATVVALATTGAGLFFKTANPMRNAHWSDAILVGASGVVVFLLPVWLELPDVPLAIWVTLMIGIAMVTRFVPLSTGHTLDDLSNTADRSTAEQIQQTVSETIFPFAASGVLIVALMGILSRLIPGSLPVLIQTVFMSALALVVLSRPLTVRLLNPHGLQFTAILLLALLPVLFTPLASVNLEINTAGLSAWLVLFLRALQCAVFATAALVPVICIVRTNPQTNSLLPAILSLIAGGVIALTAVSQNISPISILATGIAMHAFARIFNVFANEPDLRTALRSLALPAVSLLSTLLLMCGSIDTSSTSSFLFSERTAAAMQRGVTQDLIAQSQASRLISTVPAPSGEVTVWRRIGNIFEFQRNGKMFGRISTDTNISPQPAEDILPAIIPLANHAHPSRVLVLGDDTGACLQVCTHFPVQEIVAVRTDTMTTELARKITWSRAQLPPDKDNRVTILHEPAILAVRRRELKHFDIVIVSGDNPALESSVCEYSAEFYQAARSRMNANAIFCQRFRQNDLGPDPLKVTISTLMKIFDNVGVIQTVPGEILLLASDSGTGLIDSEFLSRLQRDHVRREIATAGWDWAQVAILPLLDSRDPLGMFSTETPKPAMSVANCGMAMSLPYEAVRAADKLSELHSAFGPHQQQLLAVIPSPEDHEEAKRRLSALSQQLEILAGMPDQPWIYRKSLQMEMKQSPRPPRDLIESGRITKAAHPLDLLRKDYFVSLGKALSAASRSELTTDLIHRMDQFTDHFEPLITHFAHYEIIRLHELSQHPVPIEEFRHRLHIVFFTSTTDASVRPVISAVQQLVDQPSLIADDSERYDMLNSLLQKMIERWEARTAWEPRSALRVQNDVDLSVSVANRALTLMEDLCDTTTIEESDFYSRRRFVNSALINPLRDYRDQVLAHRMKSEAPIELNTEDPHDVPLLINSGSGLNTN